MCGIVGLYLKTPKLEGELGRMTALMLHEMRDRGPDSAGFAVYDRAGNRAKITVMGPLETDWDALRRELEQGPAPDAELRPLEDHAVIETASGADDIRRWLLDNRPDLTPLSGGASIEIYKGVGDPDRIAERYGLPGRSGSHAIAHTRMATESEVTIAGSHPFSTGQDTCLVHNGSLSNHNWLRRDLMRAGERFQTENDSEVAAGYLSHRMAEGDSLKSALERALVDLDGFFTFAVGTASGFAVLRDPVACKPAVIGETDDWVAMSSEFRAIARLPGVKHAAVWEPEPGIVYSWEREQAA
ncbi:MAG: amidophosphoribosyltransferase [Minwuia sp.]|uniref:amidophosphoribosyltransferase n=1 Tax=Minwuia sp. TaxID=2493630 RepID=UPI003A893CBB